jgi:Domain of unknown function (DUF6791)/ThiF family
MNPSPHIQQLVAENYHVEILEEKFLLVKRVPYLNKDLEVRFGTIVSTLQMNGTDVALNPDHPIYFIGEQPYKVNGEKFKPNNSDQVKLLPDLEVNFYFSYKKENRAYENYYEKMTHYVHLFSKHAINVDPSVTFNIGKLVEVPGTSPFQYSDCNAASPEVNVLLTKFSGMKVGVIGLGGTGAYILDYLAKTPIEEIHLFDGDYYQNKNAFRSPGATGIDDFINIQKKTNYFERKYLKIHKGVRSHPDHIGEDNLANLDGLTFVFLSIDKSAVKRAIIEYLEKKEIDFIDVGMSVNIVDNALIGQIRTTASTKQKREHVHAKNRIKLTHNPDNDYSKIPQIAELNALNAALAVIKWKKFVGFYHDRGNEHHSIYQLHLNKLLNFDNETGT